MKLYAIRMDDSNIFVIQLSLKKGVYSVLDKKIFDDLDSAKKFLKKIKNLYLSFLATGMVDVFVSIPTDIKNPKVLKSIIVSKLKEEANITKSVIFNYYPTSIDENTKTTSYHIEGIYQDEYDEYIKAISDLNNIRFVTLDRFSLTSISAYCIKDDDFISVYTEKDRTIVVAAKNGDIIFSRINSVNSQDKDGLDFALADDVIKTVLYIRQQFRDVDFKTLLISGSLVENDLILTHLQNQSGVFIAAMYPYSFIKNLPPIWFNEWIIPFGALFAKEQFNFMPVSIRSIRQYHFALNFLSLFAVVALGYFGSKVFYNFLDYKESMQQNLKLKRDFARELKRTQLLDENRLKESKNYLSIIDQNIKFSPFEDIYTFKPLLEMAKIDSLNWSQQQDDFAFAASFEKSFEKLKNLSQFKKLFDNKAQDIKNKLLFEVKITADYNNKKLKGTIKKISKQEKEKRPSSRRRRRRR